MLIGAGLTAGCRVELGGGEKAVDTIAGDTLQLGCDRGPVLAMRPILGLPFVTERLLSADEDLLAVAKGGTLHRYDERGRAWVPLLREGKDYDAREKTLVRLRRETLDFFRYDSDRPPTLLRSLPATGHEYAIGLGDRTVFLHSPVNPENVLVEELDRRTGEWLASYLPVERSLLQLVTSNLDAILADAGSVLAIPSGFAFVPLIRDPVVIVQAGRRTILFLAGADRGTIRTVSRRTTREERTCRTCIGRREITTRQEVHQLYVDAAIDDGAMWFLRLHPPGGSRGQLIRYPTQTGHIASGDAMSVRSWSIHGFRSPIRAMTVWRDRIVVTDDQALYTLDLPLEEGAPCRRAPG